jgi:hypothetical protein
MEHAFTWGLSPGLKTLTVARLPETLPRITSLIGGIPDERLTRKQQERWSMKEHIGHLCEHEDMRDMPIIILQRSSG